MQNNILLAIQCSAGRRRLRSRPWRTDLTLGRCTSCRTNRWDYNTQHTAHKVHTEYSQIQMRGSEITQNQQNTQSLSVSCASK